jgi:enoyl-CoA hydratase/carnithine racemase
LVDALYPTESFLDNAIGFTRARLHAWKSEKPDASLRPTLPDEQERYVRLEVEDGVGIITLSEALTQLPPQHALCMLSERIVEARADEDVKALYITHDGSRMPLPDEANLPESVLRYGDFVFRRLESWPRLCALYFRGALGPLAWELALACDLRFTDRVGMQNHLIAGQPLNTARISRLGNAIQPTKHLTKEEAEKVDFLTLSDPDDALTAMKSGTPPTGAAIAIGSAKLAIRQPTNVPEPTRLLLERYLQENLFKGPDSVEGMKAYMDKRTATFSGE